MICMSCGAVVPEGQLLCDCFSIAGADELERKAVRRFESGEWPLVLTRDKAKHLISVRSRMTFCKTKAYKTTPQGIDFHRAALDEPQELKKVCHKCVDALKRRMESLADSANG